MSSNDGEIIGIGQSIFLLPQKLKTCRSIKYFIENSYLTILQLIHLP